MHNRHFRGTRIFPILFIADRLISSPLVLAQKEFPMPRGDKSSYSPKQRRQAARIEDSEEKRGYGKKRAEQIAWATVNKRTGGARGKSTVCRSKSRS
jgi:hypothetical protein